MKKVIGSLMALFFVVGITGMCFAADLGPMVTMGTPLVKMSKKSEVVIMGTGFKPGEEINVLFVGPDGLQSDIGYALKPEQPKADKTGSWTTTWAAGRYVDRKLINPKGGAVKIVVTDGEYNPIAHNAVFFQSEKEKKKKK